MTMIYSTSFGTSRLAHVVFWLGLGAAVIPAGSVSPLTFGISNVVLSMGLLLAMVGTTGTPTRGIFAIFGWSVVVLALLQTISFNASTSASSAVWFPRRSIEALSIDPTKTWRSIPHFLAPVIAMISAHALFASMRQAERFLERLAYFGGVLCVLTLLQFATTPEAFLLYEKRFYKGIFTANFVNRNTAATFCGIVTVLASSLAYPLWRERGRRYLAKRAILTAIAIIAFACTGLTKSRAGFFSTFLAMGSIAMIFSFLEIRRKRSSGSGWKLVTILCIPVLACALLGVRTITRLEQDGLESSRWCIYKSVLPVFDDHFWFGTGLGTFADVMPSYRSADCNVLGYWDYLHNGYLEVMQSSGLLGTGVLLCFIGTVALLLGRSVFSEDRFRHVPIAGLSVLILAAFHSLFDFSVQINGIAVFLGAILGAALPGKYNGRPSSAIHVSSTLTTS